MGIHKKNKEGRAKKYAAQFARTEANKKRKEEKRLARLAKRKAKKESRGK